jgi:hypothetical protein
MLSSTTVAPSEGAKLRFASAAFYVDRGIKRRQKKTVHLPTGLRKKVTVTVYAANTIARRAPVTLELPLGRLKPGTHTLTVKVSYRQTKLKHGRNVTVTVIKSLKTKFKIC